MCRFLDQTAAESSAGWTANVRIAILQCLVRRGFDQSRLFVDLLGQIGPETTDELAIVIPSCTLKRGTVSFAKVEARRGLSDNADAPAGGCCCASMTDRHYN
jgi:hypothetical protein